MRDYADQTKEQLIRELKVKETANKSQSELLDRRQQQLADHKNSLEKASKRIAHREEIIDNLQKVIDSMIEQITTRN